MNQYAVRMIITKFTLRFAGGVVACVWLSLLHSLDCKFAWELAMGEKAASKFASDDSVSASAKSGSPVAMGVARDSSWEARKIGVGERSMSSDKCGSFGGISPSSKSEPKSRPASTSCGWKRRRVFSNARRNCCVDARTAYHLRLPSLACRTYWLERWPSVPT